MTEKEILYWISGFLKDKKTLDEKQIKNKKKCLKRSSNMYTVGKTHNFVWNNDTEYFDVYSMENKIDEDESDKKN